MPNVMKNPALTFRIPKGLFRPDAGKLYFLLIMQGQRCLSRYSDSLRAGESELPNPAESRGVSFLQHIQTIHLYAMSRLRMSGVLPLLPVMPSWPVIG
jgi:hypothetical protein